MENEQNQFISRAELADLCGISTTGIYKAVKDGRIPIIRKGKDKKIYVDVMNPKVISFRNIDRSKYNKTRKRRNKYRTAAFSEIEKPLVVQKIDPPEPPEAQDISDFNDDTEINVNETNIHYIKQLESIRQMRVKTAKEQGQLIDKDKVAKVFSKMYSIDANEWKTLPENCSPEIAAILECNDPAKILKIEQFLDRKIHDILKHVKRVFLDYVEEVGADTKNLEFENNLVDNKNL